MSTDSWIELEDVRVNNLQGISVRIRHGSLTVICGVSGSGKSSLAFDTLYAEGQRRYIETFSPYTRQFLDRIERPAAASIDGIPPAIAVRQDARRTNLRGTVGSRTELADDLRMLFAALGQRQCPWCHARIVTEHPEQRAAELIRSFGSRRAMICFAWSGDEQSHSLNSLLQSGFTRIITDGMTRRIDETLHQELEPSKNDPSQILVVADRLRLDAGAESRLAEAINVCLSSDSGTCHLLIERDSSGSSEEHRIPTQSATLTVDLALWIHQIINDGQSCSSCQKRQPAISPDLFNFNSVHGACIQCAGTGTVSFDQQIGKKGRSKSTDARRITCPECRGSRLRLEANSCVVNELTFRGASALELRDLQTWLNDVRRGLTPSQQTQLQRILEHLDSRMQFLMTCGLEYLSLDRPLQSLSGGECQRVILTTALGSGLIHSLYVLDEPTSGLHESDTQKIISVVRQLRDQGNTIVVVEHDPDFILSADEVIEIGPGAGSAGGHVVFTGSPQRLITTETTATADALRTFTQLQSTKQTSFGSPIAEASKVNRTRNTPSKWLHCSHISVNNLHDLSVDLPLEVLCVITGPSGSGKSSLIVDALYPALCSLKNQHPATPTSRLTSATSACADSGIKIDNSESIDAVVLLSQEAATFGRRSIPATWIGAFDDIRKLLSETHEAKKRNYSPATFSFNSARGGRCPICEGLGIVTVDMQFLADVETPCEHCGGRRFRTDVLEVRYRDRSVHEILEMTMDEAFLFFHGHHRIQQRLGAIRSAGLGYIRLGQPLSTLSGGEVQRLNIAAVLSGMSLAEIEPTLKLQRESGGRNQRSLFLLDEPSIGLHPADIDRLMSCLMTLTQMGHSVIIIEHDPAVISKCDYLIELGPGSGSQGGQVTRSAMQC